MCVEPCTPKVVLSRWKLERLVALIAIDVSGWCLTIVDAQGESRTDFRVCTLSKTGEYKCKKLIHLDAPDKPKHCLTCDGPLEAYSVECPASSSTIIQQSCFATPLLLMSNFFPGLRARNRQEILLGIRGKPRTWRYYI